MHGKKIIKAGLWYIGIGAGAAVLLFIYSYFDPGTGIWFPKCPFHALTGLECPGCGSQRAVHALLSGDIAAAFHYNALLLLALPYLLLWPIVLTLKKIRPCDKIAAGIEAALYKDRAAWAWLVIVILFWTIRNCTTVI